MVEVLRCSGRCLDLAVGVGPGSQCGGIYVTRCRRLYAEAPRMTRMSFGKMRTVPFHVHRAECIVDRLQREADAYLPTDVVRRAVCDELGVDVWRDYQRELAWRRRQGTWIALGSTPDGARGARRRRAQIDTSTP